VLYDSPIDYADSPVDFAEVVQFVDVIDFHRDSSERSQLCELPVLLAFLQLFVLLLM